MIENREGYIEILGYKVFAGSKKECLDKVFCYNKVHIISGNPEVLYTGLKNKKILENFKSDEALIIPDGVGTQISGKILKTPVKEKIAGIESIANIISELSIKIKISINGVAQRCPFILTKNFCPYILFVTGIIL